MATTKTYLTRLLSVLLICCVFVISVFVLFKIADTFEKRVINSDLLLFLPVIVVTPGRAQVVYKSELDRFLSAHPDASLLVPLSKLDEYRNQIQTNIRSMKEPSNSDLISQLPWDADFTVEQLVHRQSFTVYASGSDDYVNVGWYEATEREIFPKYHKFYFGPGLMLRLLPVATIITALIYTFGVRAWPVLQRRILKATEA